MTPFKRTLRKLLPFLGPVVPIIGITLFGYLVFRPIPYGPLQKAARDGNLERVKSLIEAGTPIDVRCAFKNWTALHAAADSGQVSTAELLIGHGANLEARDNDGYTPLCLTGCESNGRSHPKETEPQRNQIASLLIKNGANVNARTNFEMSPLMCAVYGNDPGLAQILLQSGADYNLKDKQGYSAKDIAGGLNAAGVLDVLKRFSRP